MSQPRENIGAAQMRHLARKLTESLPEGIGFALLVFPFNTPGISNYISNARREDMVQALAETLERFINQQDFPTKEEN